MISTVEIINFESHKHTVIDFHSGFNCISGKSGHGKSSIRRAIGWVTDNRPIGIGKMSWWIQDKKKLTGTASVTITMANGNVVKRERSPVENVYYVNGVKLEAVGSDVPEDVTKALGFSDFNIQKQFDPQFLIARSPGEVAQYLNKIVNLDDIDYYQTAIKSKKTDCVKAIKANDERLKMITEQLGKLDWVEKAETIIAEYTALAESVKAKEAEVQQLKYELSSYDDWTRKLEQCSCLARAEELIGAISAIKIDRTEIQQLQRELTLYNSYDTVDVDMEKAERLIRKIDRYRSIVQEDRLELNTIIAELGVYNTAKDIIVEIDMELIPYEQELATVDVCPTCGKSLYNCLDIPF